MLIEHKDVRQAEGEGRKRWFSDDYFDLIIWEDEAGDILRFDLCYGKGKDEHALIWNKTGQIVHLRVDDGEGRLGRFKMSPVLLSDGMFDKGFIAARFIKAGDNIDRKVSEFVYNRINSCQNGRD